MRHGSTLQPDRVPKRSVCLSTTLHYVGLPSSVVAIVSLVKETTKL